MLIIYLRAMARERRTTNKNNLVILCEGTETEVRYFKDLRNYVNSSNPDRFSDIKIVPVVDDVVSTKSSKRKQRTLASSSEYRYYEKEETNADTYKKYKSQPVRYVREVQLFMEEDGYMEGWAVFDRDTFTHHEEAFALAASVNDLHIAFSSYCFEEWFLAHFERNPHPFMVSVCKDSNDKDKGCGTGVVDDCHGEICLAGRLRECKYIANYAKNQESIFENYTLSHLESCYVNAAWMRTLSTEPIYQRNPYTDVDRLVKHLLDDNREHYWHEPNQSFEFCRSAVRVNYSDGVFIISNEGAIPIILNSRNSVLCNMHCQEQRGFNGGMLDGNSCKQMDMALSESEVLLRLTDGYNVHYIPLK